MLMTSPLRDRASEPCIPDGGFQQLPFPQEENTDTWQLQKWVALLLMAAEGDEGTAAPEGHLPGPGSPL